MARRSLWIAFALLAVLAAWWFARRTSDPELATASRTNAAAEDVDARNARDARLAEETLAAAPSADGTRIDVAPAPNAPPSVPATMLIGRVLASDGKPIVGARVRRGTADELERARLDPQASFELGKRELATPSDLEGRFVFADVPADGEALIVGPHHEDFAADLGWTIARPGGECVLTMTPLVSGELVIQAMRLPTYEPIPYFTARVEQLDRHGSRGLRGVNVQGSKGEARTTLRFLPGAAVEVELGVPTMAIGRGPSTVRTLTPIEGDAVVARFEIDPFAEPADAGMFVATGVVLDRTTREPLQGASITSTVALDAGRAGARDGALPSFATQSDSHGRFRVRLAQPSAKLTVAAPRHCATEVAVRDQEDVVVELDRGTQVTIRVRHADGRPVKNRAVMLRHLDPRTGKPSFCGLATNQDGVGERSDLAPGKWEVRITRVSPAELRSSAQSALRGQTETTTVGDDAWLIRTVELSLEEPTEVTFEVDD